MSDLRIRDFHKRLSKLGEVLQPSKSTMAFISHEDGERIERGEIPRPNSVFLLVLSKNYEMSPDNRLRGGIAKFDGKEWTSF